MADEQFESIFLENKSRHVAWRPKNPATRSRIVYHVLCGAIEPTQPRQGTTLDSFIPCYRQGAKGTPGDPLQSLRDRRPFLWRGRHFYSPLKPSYVQMYILISSIVDISVTTFKI